MLLPVPHSPPFPPEQKPILALFEVAFGVMFMISGFVFIISIFVVFIRFVGAFLSFVLGFFLIYDGYKRLKRFLFPKGSKPIDIIL